MILKAKEKADKSLKALDKELEVVDKDLQNKFQRNQNVDEKHAGFVKRICRHHNGGYCKHKSRCLYEHPASVCEIFLKDGKCTLMNCTSRHPKQCKYQSQGCYRGILCAYRHEINQEKEQSDQKEQSDKNEQSDKKEQSDEK